MANRSSDSRPDHWVSFVPLTNVDGESFPRHMRMFGSMGLTDRVVAELPLGMGVVELADAARTRAGLLRVGKALRDVHLVDAIVLGCAGMAEHRDWLQDQLGVFVVEPVQAAVSMALGRVLLGWGPAGRPATLPEPDARPHRD